MISLSAGDWRAEVLPDLGGSIGRLDWRGKPVLRAAPPRPRSPLETGCFPLVPFANRIDRGRFSWAGRTIDLGPTPGFEPHALHGQGWREAWTVIDQEEATVRLGLRVAAGSWPWAWRAEQIVSLGEEGLRVHLSLTNDDDRPMPAGAGLHPYFATAPNDRLRLSAAEVWVGEGLIPDRRVHARALFDGSAGPARSAVPLIDNAYEGWSGVAEVGGAARTVRLSSPVSRLHVYAPVGEPFICLEPVTHRPDAHNAPTGEDSGLAELQPADGLRLTMGIDAYAAQ